MKLLHCRLYGEKSAVSEEARKGFPPTAIWGMTTSVGSTFLSQASPPLRPHGRIQNVFRRIGSGPHPLFFIPPVRPGVRGHPFQGTMWRFGLVRLLNTNREILEQPPHSFFNRAFRQFLQASTWLGVGITVCWSPVSSPSSIPSPHTPLLHYLHICYPNPLFTVIHNRTNVEIDLYHITLPIGGCQGPLWSTLQLSTIIIIQSEPFCTETDKCWELISRKDKGQKYLHRKTLR